MPVESDVLAGLDGREIFCRSTSLPSATASVLASVSEEETSVAVQRMRKAAHGPAARATASVPVVQIAGDSTSAVPTPKAFEPTHELRAAMSATNAMRAHAFTARLTRVGDRISLTNVIIYTRRRTVIGLQLDIPTPLTHLHDKDSRIDHIAQQCRVWCVAVSEAASGTGPESAVRATQHGCRYAEQNRRLERCP